MKPPHNRKIEFRKPDPNSSSELSKTEESISRRVHLRKTLEGQARARAERKAFQAKRRRLKKKYPHLSDIEINFKLIKQ